MTKWKLHLFFAFMGKGWSSLLLLVGTPFYIHFLGVEAFGLVGFFQSLLILSNLLELGLGTTLNKEMAALSANEKECAEAKQNLVYTLERIYWGIALLVGLLTLVSAPLLAKYWFNPQQILLPQLQTSLLYMGGAIAFQMPMYIYSSGLMGLHQQVPLNLVNILASTLRLVGTLLLLRYFHATVTVFFIAQAFASLFHTLLLRRTLWRFVRDTQFPQRFSIYYLKKIWKFSLGVSGIYLTSILISQSDKIWISKFFSLETLGFYSIAGLLAQGLYTIINPIFSVFFPQFSELVSTGKSQQLTELYHKSCKVMALILFPFAGTLICFPGDVLILWTGKPEIVQQTAPILIFLLLGTALNGAVNLPYALQLAHGWVRFSLYQNLITLVIFPPILIFLAHSYGAIGAASCWFIVNGGFALFSIPLMHRKLLPSEGGRWLLDDLFKPFMLAMLVPLLCSSFFPSLSNPFLRLGKLALVYLLTCAIAYLFIYSNRWKNAFLSLLLKRNRLSYEKNDRH